VKSSTLSLYVRREVVPVFGLGGSALSTRAGLAANVPLGEAWWLAANADYTLPEDVEGVPVQPAGTYAFVALGRRLGHRLSLSAEGRYRRRGEAGALPTIDGIQAGLFLTLIPPGAGSTRPKPITEAPTRRYD
jgi:hypothetical protein